MSASKSSAALEPRDVTALEVAERLRTETRIVVVSHESPDGDALGSLAALLLVAEELGIDCLGYVPGDSPFPSEYLFLDGLGGVRRGSPPPFDADTTVYLLDCASFLRSNLDGFVGHAVRVNIDHHQDNPRFAEFNLLDSAAPSTTAILHEVFKAGGLAVDARVATALYVGLLTDTGCFQYSNTTPAAHLMAAELQEAGVDVNSVYRHVYESTPLPKLLLLQRALSHLEIRLGGALVVSWLKNDDFVQAGADEGHAEGIIDELRRIRGVRVAALLRERVGREGADTKVSLRSTDGEVNVAAVANRQGGGGHLRAAGFSTSRDVHEVATWIEEQIAGQIGNLP